MRLRGALFALLLASCSEEDREGLSAMDASVADASDATDAALLEPLRGAVTISQSLDIVRASALFQADGADGFGCTEVVFGACRVLSCAGTGGPKTYPHAGDITVVAETNMLAIEPGVGGVYATAELDARWTPGAPVNISAAGDDVPAFAAALTVPLSLSTAGTWISGAVSSKEPLEASWESTGPGRALIGFSGDTGPSSYVYAECAFDAQAERGTVPPEVLRLLPADQVEVMLKSADVKEVQADRWTVKLTTERLDGLGAIGISHE